MNQVIPIELTKDNFLQPEGIDLTDSFILGWNFNGQTLSIQLELSVWPSSRYYKTPKAGEYTFYQKGRLEFENIQSISGYKPLDLKDSTLDPDSTQDWGCIYGLKRDDSEITFETEFTEIKLTCSEINLTLDKEEN